MPKETLPKWLTRRGEHLHFYRRVPTRYAHLDSRRFVFVSCDTKDVGQAVIARDKLNAALEAYWKSLARGDDPDARERYVATVELARMQGFAYQQPEALLTISDGEKISRLRTMVQAVPAGGRAPPPPAAKRTFDALTGAEPKPSITISTMLGVFESLTVAERRNKSENQVHKWRLPRLRAVENLRAVIGDKSIADIDRADANAFHAWWSERLVNEEMSAESPNKDLSVLARILSTLSDRLSLGMQPQFTGLRFRVEQEPPPPYSAAFIRDRLLAPGALDTLQEEARAVVLMMIEVGARPIELANLRPEDIRLDADIPHISIEPYKGYSLKTVHSKRLLPLVGVALTGARIMAAGSGRYRDRNGSLSATVSKHFRTRKLQETDKHTLYSLRHSFRDRLTSVSAPDSVDTALMGHAFPREKYGGVPSLAVKLEWLLKITLTGGDPRFDPRARQVERSDDGGN